MARLLAEATALATPVSVFDPADDRFIAPGDMPTRIAAWCVEHGLRSPAIPADFTRSIMESLANAYAHAIDTAAALTGKKITAVHIVGGGSQNALLCQLTANRTGLVVLAGPVEATAIGNILVQARTAGLITGTLEALRSTVGSAFRPHRYAPTNSVS